MAGPDNPVDRDNGIVRARIEARTADPMEFGISIKLVVVEREPPGADEIVRTTFPVVEVDGFDAVDHYRFATPGTSWSEEEVVVDKEIVSVNLSEENPAPADVTKMSDEEFEITFDPMFDLADRWGITPTEAEIFLEEVGYFDTEEYRETAEYLEVAQFP